MSKLQCKTCLGVWVTPDPTNYLIFHSCPPVSVDNGFSYTERAQKVDTNLKINPDGTKTTVLPGKGTDVIP